MKGNEKWTPGDNRRHAAIGPGGWLRSMKMRSRTERQRSSEFDLPPRHGLESAFSCDYRNPGQ